MEWFKVDAARFRPTKIIPVEIERFTASSIWIKGKRFALNTDWDNYFPTWELAHNFLLTNAQQRVEDARRNLEFMRGYHGNIKGMKKP